MASNHRPIALRRRGESRLQAELRRSVTGEVEFDLGARGAYAHDASNYRHPPLGVVAPRSEQDVLETLRICRAFHAPVVSRGCGTSLAGQAINEAVILDFTRHFGGVLELDVNGRRARVRPGTVLDDLRTAALAHGLTFGPDPATHDRCTLGGMIGNNSCGIHAVQAEFYGPGARTSDQVEELEIATYDGLRMRVGPTSEAQLEQNIAEGGRRGEIYRRLRDLRDRHADAIRREFPDIPRRVSGYNLPELLPERGFHVARALVGSEATCVTVLSATVTLIPALAERVLVAVGFPSIGAAGDVIPLVREHRPIGCEGFGHRLLELISEGGGHGRDLELLPAGRAWLLVEFGAEQLEDAEQQAHTFIQAITKTTGPPTAEIIEQRSIEERLWKLRESALSATAHPSDEPDTWPGWEDSAVPPDRVGVYLREFKALLHRHGHGAALYGHFGQGCIHTRVSFNLSTATGIERYRQFTEEAAELVVRHGGSLSGEHGDGQARGDLLPKMYSPEVMAAMLEFKRIWDPEQRMNPGRVVEPLPRTESLKLAHYHPEPQDLHFLYRDDHGSFAHAANRCVGVGECRRQSGGVMCPSYMVTGEERHSTRGRARLLFEMLDGDLIEDGWHSDAVFEALDLCLACKGCKRECPVHVDMATYKAEFMAHHYDGRLRPRSAYSLGWIHRWARLGARVPRIANLLLQTPGSRALAKWLAGVSQQREIPRLATRTFRQRFAARPPPAHGGPRVLLWPDTFNNLFFPEVLEAATRVLERCGYVVTIPQQPLCCGRALYDFGMIDTARQLWRETLDALALDIAIGTPIVGLEPSCVAAFRDELPNLFHDDARARQLTAQTKTLAELLDAHDELPLRCLDDPVLLHFHCHHRSVLHVESDLRLLERVARHVDIPDSGCCGMAGAFGFEIDKYDVSIAIGERALLPAVRNADTSQLIVADGFSCREQIRQTTGRMPLHLAELLDRAARAVQP